MSNFKLTIVFLITIAIFEVSVALRKPNKAKEDRHPSKNESAYSSYTLHNRKENWGDAWRHCKDNGGHLVVIDSKGELKVIVQLINSYGLRDNVYLGVHDMFQEGRFITVTGKDIMVSNYNIWAPEEPNNYMDTEDCVILTPSGLMYDVACSGLHSYICEYEWYN